MRTSSINPRRVMVQSGSRNMSGRPAMTLIEMVVVLSVISMIAVVSGLALRRPAAEKISDASKRIQLARQMAVDSARSISVIVSVGNTSRVITAHADGRVVADSGVPVEMLSGAIQ